MNGNAFKTDQDGDYTEMLLGDTLDYSHEWADFLAASGNDSIAPAGSTWTAPAGVAVSGPDVSGSVVYAFFTPSAAGTYRIENTITTVGGRIKKDSFRIIVKA